MSICGITVSGYRGACYKGFRSVTEAEEAYALWVRSEAARQDAEEFNNNEDVMDNDHVFDDEAGPSNYQTNDTQAVQVANKLELVHLLFGVMTVLIGLWNVEHLTLQSCLVEVLSKNLNRMKGSMLLWNLRWLKLNVLSYASCLHALPVLLQSALFLETLVVENKIEPRESAYYSTNMIADTELGLQLDHTEYLRTVEMKNFKASDDELKFLKILLNTASALEKIIFTGAEQEYTNWMFNIVGGTMSE